MSDIDVWAVLIDVIPIILSIIALFVAFYFSRGKYKLKKKDVEINGESLRQQKYDSWLNEISPEPHINIWDGKVGIKYQRSTLGDEINDMEGWTISAKIANSIGTANEPKWTYRINFKNIEPFIGSLSDNGVSIQIGLISHQISYIPSESQTFYIESSLLGSLPSLELIVSLEIWVNYSGKRNTQYFSYKKFKYIDGRWTDENKRTKVRRESLR